MDWLFPGLLNLKKVNFHAKEEVEFMHNYNLLQASFKKKGVNKVCFSFFIYIFHVFSDSNEGYHKALTSVCFSVTVNSSGEFS